MKNFNLKKSILIKNRQNGDIETRVDTKKEYDYIYKQMLKLNDIKMAIKVFCDLQGVTEKELIKDFNLVELVNCFSTRYMAITINGVVVEKYNTGVRHYGN